jgi:Flp pilus assembly protein TadD
MQTRLARFMKLGAIGPLLAGVLMLGACAHTVKTTIQGVGPATSQETQPVKEVSKEQVSLSLARVADSLRENGEYKTAIGVYERAREADPKNVELSLGLAKSLWAVGDWEDAGRAYEDAHALDPNNPEARIGIANALLATGRLDEAIAQFNKLIAAMPDAPKVYSGLGIAFDLEGKHKDAQLRYGMGLEVAPKNAALTNNLAVSFALAKDFSTAEELLKTMPDNPKTRQNLALVYGLANQPQEAEKMARMDLNEQDVANNLAYYTYLRSLDPRSQAEAVLLGHSTSDQPQAQVAETAPANPSETAPAVPAIPAEIVPLAEPKSVVRKVPQTAATTPAAADDATRDAEIKPEAGPSSAPEAAPEQRVAEVPTPDQPKPAVVAPQPAPKAATKPTSKLYQAQLASFRSYSETEGAKEKLEHGHPDLLAGFNLVIEQADLGPDKGSYHRLRTAPVADKDSTQALCRALKATGAPCFVVATPPNDHSQG